MTKKIEKNNVKEKVALGLGVVAALSAGAYYLYGTKEGAKKRVKVRGWVLKAKGEILEKLEGLKEVNQKKYDSLISTVMKKYQGVKSIDKSELNAVVKDLKKHWKSIKRHVDVVAMKPVQKRK